MKLLPLLTSVLVFLHKSSGKELYHLLRHFQDYSIFFVWNIGTLYNDPLGSEILHQTEYNSIEFDDFKVNWKQAFSAFSLLIIYSFHFEKGFIFRKVAKPLLFCPVVAILPETERPYLYVLPNFSNEFLIRFKSSSIFISIDSLLWTLCSSGDFDIKFPRNNGF